MAPSSSELYEIVPFLRARFEEDELDAKLGADGPYGAKAGRILADVQAKRQILEIHRPLGKARGWPKVDNETFMCESCLGASGPTSNEWPCPTLVAVASTYADHPDYHAEWWT